MALLTSIGFSIIAFLFVLGVMIFIHELGHHIAAKLLGIRVDVFSLGFGRRLFGFKRGDTDYRVSLLPLGGYVKMAGENYDEEPTGDPGEFMGHPKTHRFLVAIAGPAMNIILALILVTTNLMLGTSVAKHMRQPAVIGSVQEGSAAEQAGLQPLDIILAIDGDPIPTWQDLVIGISLSPNQELVLEVERQGQVLTKNITPSLSERIETGDIGVGPFIPFIITEVEPNSPATEAGLRPEDEIVRVTMGNKSTVGFDESARLINASEGSPLKFEVLRDNQVFETTFAAVQMEDRWRIGTTVEYMQLEQYGFLQALKHSFERNLKLTLLTFNVVGRIFTGRTSLRAMSGPIEIARFSGMAAAMGLVPLLNFMALVSLQLGIFNLMPIPILDGGVIALLGIEGLIRRDLSMRVKERIFQVGFVFLILLMGIVIFNDLAKNLPILN
ncbi:MAG: RIP metalloprotease RseP [Acidobacteria bacterium]|nr:RIP metalloprotease RseP [candidate division NC10 bacterium]MCZ6768343.1 RIP metalloprotease RseP [Acidobacteriota bacterium]